MAKKVKIDIDFEQDNTLYGISCHKKDYWLAFRLNELFKIKFIRIKDLPSYNLRQEVLLNYPLFHFEDHDTLLSYYLISNHNPEGKLFASLKTMDFFLLINGRISDEYKYKLLPEMKKIQNVLTVFEIEIVKLKEVDNFLSDLELHMLDCLNY